MIDTIKLKIKLTEFQFKKIEKIAKQQSGWQWVKYHAPTDCIDVVRLKGLAETDQNSFHRSIFWDIPDRYIQNDTHLTLELSLPKFWYGHNIRLLYNYLPALRLLKNLLEKQLHCRFSKIEEWQVMRLDICYAWQCPTQMIAQQVLDSLKHLHYPRKKPTIYPTSILFAGTTYSLKFYLKLPEFINHDRKILLERKYSLEWIEYLEKDADGVLRVEATLRRKYLKSKGINTIGNLINFDLQFIPDKELIENYPDFSDNIKTTIYALLAIYFYNKGFKDIDKPFGEHLRNLKDGICLHAPKYQINSKKDPNLFFLGGSIQFRRGNILIILIYFLDKFLGNYKGMDDIEKVKLKLLEKYKPARATKLIGFWLYVQRFGSNEAKEIYGDDSFYRCKKDLKSAEVSLLEPVKVIDASDRFMKEFKIEIPSEYVKNKLDDFRDSGNLLNLFKVDDR